MGGLLDIVPAGVVDGKDVYKVFDYAREHKFAIPAFNVTSTNTANAAMEAARDIKSPVILQVSQGGAAFWAGKGLGNDKQEASIAGATAFAHFVRAVAPSYGIPVILHSDHCAKKLLPWFDGMLAADEAYYKKEGKPLFSSHMLDLSEEPKEENIEICLKYLKRMAPIGVWLEMEIGITGGEEDGVNNEGVENASLYTQPEDIWDIYKAFSEVTPNFSIAAGFGNVHGVYKVAASLKPELLKKHQEYVRGQLKTDKELPVFLVFHGGSGSSKDDIKVARENGVVKMNLDTDLQWAFTAGLRDYFKKNAAYLENQVGNPEGANKPNKKYYDPRVVMRSAETGMVTRCKTGFEDLNCVGHL